MNIRTIAAGVAAAALLAPTAASAASSTFTDTQGDIAHGVDLWSVKVTNAKRVNVHLQHKNLIKSVKQIGGISIFLDTDPANAGPEYVLGAGLYGSDYQLSKTDGWKPVGEPLSCKHSLRYDYATDKTHTWFNRKCIGSPSEVRVAVKVAGEKKDGTILTDWYKKRRGFTAWVAQG